MLRLIGKLGLGIILSINAFGMAVSAQSSERLTVVELFTSQGCSSCPPADAALRTLRDRPGVLTLSWPVDYWDRLGWEDTFALPANAKRQIAYNKRFGRGGIYTPQMVFDGRYQCVGSRPDKVRESLDSARNDDHILVNPDAVLGGNTISVSLPETQLSGMDAVAVRVVWYLADAEVQVGNGENRGRRLHYTNVVRRSDMMDEWSGESRNFTLDISAGRAAGADHVAVLLQEEYGHGAIIGATSIALDAEEPRT